MPKNSAGDRALRDMNMNSRLRQRAMPERPPGTNVSRPRKKLRRPVVTSPESAASRNTSGTFGVSMKP
jgi:hypothetical protein